MIAQLFGIGVQGKSANITAQRRVNLYYDIQAQADKTKISAIGTPGLVMFAGPSGNPTRGIYYMESLGELFVVQGSTLYQVANDGTTTVCGSLNTSDTAGRVSMSDNGTAGNQLIIVTGAYGYIWNTSTLTLSPITFPNVGTDTVTFLDSFFIVNRTGTGQFWLSNSYDGTTWSGLAYATAESNPDPLIAVAADREGLALFGSISVELWYNVGTIPVPYQRIDGAPAESGLAARWSLARCAGMWTGLFRNRQSALTIGRLNGYTIESISNPDLDYLINNYNDPMDAVAFAYTLNGKHFYQISFQAQAATWLFDSDSGLWTQLQSNGLTRHIGDLGAAFGNNIIVTDYRNGNLYRLSADTYTDNGEPIPREIVGSHVFSAEHLNQMRIRRMRLDMEGGIGLTSGQGSNPTVMLQISRDGGHTWGNELWTTIGQQGQYAQRAEWRRLGHGRSFVFKVRITDPVKVVMLNCYVEGEESVA